MSVWKSDHRCVREGIILSFALLFLCRSLYAGQEAAAVIPGGERVVPLTETSVWEVDEQARSSFIAGLGTDTRATESGGLKYPSLKSGTPLYGRVRVQFMAGDAVESRYFHFAIDHSQGQPDTYDLLHFDENGDADLANDNPKRLLKNTPKGLLTTSSARQQVYFESVRLSFDFGSEGRKPVELLPRLELFENRPARFSLVPAVVHTGKVEIDGAAYQFFLGYDSDITGRLDLHTTTLLIGPKGGKPAFWWGGKRLDATHLIGRRYYRFSCTPTGDKLFLRPYDGPFGTLEVGAGGRKIEKLEMQGSLRAKDTAVAIGEGLEDGWPKVTRRCRIPVGDYYPAVVTVRLGDLAIEISNNYHVNVQGQLRTAREPVHGIMIRQDRPYVLDFSNKPAVVFAQPGDEKPIRPGNTVTVKAVLVDPVLDIMIRGLDDMAHIKTTTVKMADGQERTYKKARSLDPKVVVTRADGEIVAQGVMPFG